MFRFLPCRLQHREGDRGACKLFRQRELLTGTAAPRVKKPPPLLANPTSRNACVYSAFIKGPASGATTTKQRQQRSGTASFPRFPRRVATVAPRFLVFIPKFFVRLVYFRDCLPPPISLSPVPLSPLRRRGLLTSFKHNTPAVRIEKILSTRVHFTASSATQVRRLQNRASSASQRLPAAKPP